MSVIQMKSQKATHRYRGVCQLRRASKVACSANRASVAPEASKEQTYRSLAIGAHQRRITSAARHGSRSRGSQSTRNRLRSRMAGFHFPLGRSRPLWPAFEPLSVAEIWQAQRSQVRKRTIARRLRVRCSWPTLQFRQRFWAEGP
jgi:hypothetical protein